MLELFDIGRLGSSRKYFGIAINKVKFQLRELDPLNYSQPESSHQRNGFRRTALVTLKEKDCEPRAEF